MDSDADLYADLERIKDLSPEVWVLLGRSGKYKDATKEFVHKLRLDLEYVGSLMFG